MRILLILVTALLMTLAAPPVPGAAQIHRHSVAVTCSACGGSGVCWVCHGSGKRIDGDNCGICHGSGRCAYCDGRGEH
jgi:hypothetical protein